MSQLGIREVAKAKREPGNREAGCIAVAQVREGVAYAETPGDPASTGRGRLTN